MKVVCLGCRQQLDYPDLAPAQIVNLVSSSVLIVEHPQQVYCQNCKVAVTVGVASVNLQMAAVPVPPEVQKSVVLAPNGLPVN